MNTKAKDQKGFTLVELLIALTIFAIGLLSIAGMQITAIRANSSANTLSVASSVAQRVMEEILSRSSTDPFFTSEDTDATWDLDPDTAGTTIDIAGAGTYSAKYTITTDDPVSNVTRIAVTVNGGNRTVNLTGFKRAI